MSIKRVATGVQVSFTVYNNEATKGATNIVGVLAFPAELTYVSSVAATGTYTPGTKTWAIPTLAAQTGTNLDVVFSISDSTAAPFDVTLTISSDDADPNAANNVLTRTIDLNDSALFPPSRWVNEIDDTDSPYSVLIGVDETIIVDASAGDVTVNLGDAALHVGPNVQGLEYTIRVKDDNAGAQTVTIDGGADTIFNDDETSATTLTIVEGEAVTIVSDGTNYHVVGNKSGHVGASATGPGTVELATVSEINTGTDASRVMAVDDFAGSDFGVKEIFINLYDIGTDVDTTTGIVGATIPDSIDGMDLVGARATVHTLGTSTGAETITVNVSRRRAGADVSMLSTPISLEKTEYTIADGAIDAANDDVLAGDMVFPVVTNNLDTTDATGMTVALQFRKP